MFTMPTGCFSIIESVKDVIQDENVSIDLLEVLVFDLAIEDLVGIDEFEVDLFT